MPRSSTWAFSVEVLAAYAHSTQAADLQLCPVAAYGAARRECPRAGLPYRIIPAAVGRPLADESSRDARDAIVMLPGRA
jgi:hypothetical protein